MDRERWDIDAGGTEANDVHSFGQTGRETTAVLAGRSGRSPTATSARARVTDGGRRSNSEILRARCAERQLYAATLLHFPKPFVDNRPLTRTAGHSTPLPCPGEYVMGRNRFRKGSLYLLVLSSWLTGCVAALAVRADDVPASLVDRFADEPNRPKAQAPIRFLEVFPRKPALRRDGRTGVSLPTSPDGTAAGAA